MTPEQKAAHDALIVELKSQIEKLIGEKSASKEEIKTFNDKLNSLEEKSKEIKSPEDYETLKKEHASLMGDVKALKEAPKAKKEVKSVRGQIAAALEEKAEELKGLKSKKGASINLEVKAAGTMTTSNVDAVGTNGLSMLLNDPEAGITPIPRSQPFFADLFSSSPTSGNTVSYAEMKNPDGGAGMTGEGSAKTQADFDLVEAKSDVKKITSYIKTSKEALDDIPALSGEINNELLTLIKLKKDAQVLSGDGLSNNLSGVLTNATTFTGGDLAGTIDSPNNYDVLVAAITEIMTAEVVSGEPAGFLANVIVLNPVDVAAMKLTKDQNDNYIFPVTLPGATTVMEVPVVSNARMTSGTFLVMDSTKGNLRIREGITIDIGYENDDFTKNLVTILAEMRLAFYIKSQHVKAFVTGTFEAAKALLVTAP